MRHLFASVAAVALLTGLLQAAQTPQSVEAGQEATRPDYRTTGLIEAAFSWGSGVVAEHPRVVLSCAHVVFDDLYNQWTSGARWYRAYNGAGAPAPAISQPLNGYFYWRSYASAVEAAVAAWNRVRDYPLELPLPDRLYDRYLRAVAEEFNLDAIAYFSYAADLGAGEFAPVFKDGAAQLSSNAPKWITGYPGGRYPEGDPLEYRLHDTGGFDTPLLPEFAALKNYVTAYDEVETGSGNSGGPVWIQNSEGKPSVAGILVSGAELETEGESLIGVHATSTQSWNLIKSAMSTAGAADQTVTEPYDIMANTGIPDARRLRIPGGHRMREGELARTFRVRGLPKSIVEVRVDLVIQHSERTDLRVILQTPGKRRLPIYEGSLDEAGADLEMEDEEAPLFYGLNPNGNWVLRVIDTLPGETGRLVSATVHIKAR